MIEAISQLPPAALEAAGLVLTAMLVVGGWLFTSHRQRVLLRRQCAVDLLNSNRFESALLDAKKTVYGKMISDPHYDWAALVTKNRDAEEQALFDHALTLLNYLEFLAIAVLNRAADEDLIRWSHGFYFEQVGKKLASYITNMRTSRTDDEIFINITTLHCKWEKKPEPAYPTDGFLARFFKK